MRGWANDLKLAVRQMLRNPGFAATVVITLALAIGANTAIFSLVNALMLRSLPYADPQRLGAVFTRIDGSGAGDFHNDINGEQWERLRENVPSLETAVASDRTSGVNLRAGQQTQYVHAGRVSAHYLDVLALHPALGRNFIEAEDREGGPKAAILSYGLWSTVFGGNRNMVGAPIFLKGEPYTVVGVLARGAATPLNADLYTPLRPSRAGEGEGSNYNLIVRLRNGASWQQADAELNRAWVARAQRSVARNPGSRVTFHTVPLQQGQAAEFKPRVVALMLAAGAILLIACANLAGLTLVRMARRRPELATRLALGAGRWQIRRQLWVENLLLALVGGLFGVAVGWVALQGLLSLLPVGYLPVTGVALDNRVLGFTFAVAVGSSLLFGMLPALSLGSMDLRAGLSQRTVAGVSRIGLRQALIAGEVALTAVLLAGSGLLVRSLIHLETLPPGFDPEGVMTGKASLDDARYHDAAAVRKLMAESVAAMKRIPGVENAAAGLNLPYERPLNAGAKVHDGPEAGTQSGTDLIYVTPEYFSTLRIPLVAGRYFTGEDGPATQPVAIVNRAFAQKFFHGANPVGRTLNKNTAIVGMTGDVKLTPGIDTGTAPLASEATMYVPVAQVESEWLPVVHVWFQPSWIVRTTRPVEGLTAQMQQALAGVDPGLPFSGFYRMKDLEAETLATQRIEVALLASMAGLALLLSVVGIFALVASLVTERTREIGIRMALGARISGAMAQVASSGLGAAAAGLALGGILCAFALRLMQSVVYGVSVYDWPTLSAVALGLGLISLVGSTLPALRIARIDPARTLRED